MRLISTRAMYTISIAVVVATGLGVGVASAVNHGSAASPGRAPALQRFTDYPRSVGGCGQACASYYSQLTGTKYTMSVTIPADNGKGGRVGIDLILHAVGPNRPDANFTRTVIGRASQFCDAQSRFFTPSSYICTNLSNMWVFEVDWSPHGNQSGLCVGVASPGQNDQNVTLQNCGQDDRTLWIADRLNGAGGDCRFTNNWCPWVSANDRGAKVFPLVLSVRDGSAGPRQLKIEPLIIMLHSKAVHQEQFAFFWGPVAK